MRSPLVVCLAIVFHDHSRFRQRLQLFPIQTLIAESTVKAFYKAVLPQTTGINVERFDLVLPQPALHGVGDELGPVV